MLNFSLPDGSLYKTIEQSLETSQSYLIVGDIMLDCYIKGSVKRVSPEAPVPVVNVAKKEYKPGGAGNVALNLAGLNSYVTLCGFTGGDHSQEMLINLFKSFSIDFMPVRWDRATITKTRILSGKQQIVRVDDEDQRIPSDDESDILLAVLKGLDFGKFKGVIISDYNKGVCSDKICRYIISEGKKSNIPVVIDPKGTNWKKYEGANLVTPNLKELGDILSIDIPNEDDIIVEEGNKIRKLYRFDNIVVTRSEKGMMLIGSDEVRQYPTVAREVFDVSGAGDTVIACFLRFITENLSINNSIELANFAAGIVVGYIGTHPITKELMLEGSRTQISYTKDMTLDQAKGQNRKIIFTNGCFDILHPGHIDYLQKAKALGDYLVVGLNSDLSVKRLKGDSRPINNQQSRKIMLEALQSVDLVILFDEDTPLDLIKQVAPTVLVKGGDYAIKDIVGREYADKTMTIPFLEGYSSTTIIERIQKIDG